MPGQYFHRLFGGDTRLLQERAGSRASYARREAASSREIDVLKERELSFIAARDSVYLASVAADRWLYVQHRGGPKGFIRHQGSNRLAILDYPGNRQYISVGNVLANGGVALIGVDYPARRRLKLIGYGEAVIADEEAVPGASSEGASGSPRPAMREPHLPPGF